MTTEVTKNELHGEEFSENYNLLLEEIAKPQYYNNRELSWLAFNERVLEEAEDINNPLLERLKFLAIFSSNLDEFFMVRVAGLQDQVRAGFHKPENKSGLTPKEQLAKIAERTQALVRRQTEVYRHLIYDLLPQHNVHIADMKDLNSKQKSFINEMFAETIFPVLTPVAVDAYRPFPTLLGKTLNLLVLLEQDESDLESRERVAIVQVPSVLDRYIKVPSEEGKTVVVLLEDVIVAHIEKLFYGYSVKSAQAFRLTRNADLTIHEEGARDLLVEIEKELKKRKWGVGSRLEVRVGEMNEEVLQYLLDEFEIEESDVFHIDGPLDLTFMFSFVKGISVGREHLEYESFIPQPPLDLQSDENIFEKALQQDIFFHHPYESFAPIVDFISEAAVNPNVLAIKQTLYRVSGNSPIIQALKLAAENGKQVTVLVELKARFDEENNVHWAKQLEQAGCLVIYGMNNLKTHSKITLVVSRRNGKIERFVHLGTGNYNDATAKIYTDMGIITTDKEFGIDATNFFNYLSGYTEKPTFNHLVVAPFDIRDEFIRLMDEEIACHKKYGNGFIRAKMNSLTDKDLMMKLYEASIAGVKVELIIRGICCIRPGIPGISENITVTSIVGRFLEHSRIYWFHHNGENKVYLSSADMMTRNMIKRVEILFPVYASEAKTRIIDIMNAQLMDTAKARIQDSNGKYHYKEFDRSEDPLNSQEIFLKDALKPTLDEE
ncbi:MULTISPECIES: RNA degradosome polyphosphate kinase [Lysinibacillus]|uniref:RNA degradosome polyphosphate kinase n=1 Tax=Lysinibacillus TaxID=400634 RepID=UPI001C8C35FC|nr:MULTISPECIES: RNA degradosome polyphosphate kinase [Lysinibacillus]MBX8942857.1 RNA degradosome polyphosphate kinase [Lysinibacillus sp. K60]MED3796831.1 RNA degradosome polyphosphate kinase [Lysinibacillus capsici]UNT54849.1 RNA degradosome polyphosphate kinase [Lysinibacillus capsici]UUV25254.1 RNA degradosome polyphosphate kinase [Lysinibacillus sp. FN11]UYB48125.1 RNA degradosome polyphosphate kinase [Lysinibacillus capsici]